MCYPICAFFIQRYLCMKIVRNLPHDPATAVEELWRRKSELQFRLTLSAIPPLLVSILGGVILIASTPEDKSGGWYLLGICVFVLAVFIANQLSAFDSNKMLRGDTWTKPKMLISLMSIQLYLNSYTVSLVLTLSLLAIIQDYLPHGVHFDVIQAFGAIILFIGLVFGLSNIATRTLRLSRVESPEIVEVLETLCHKAGKPKPNLIALDTSGGNLALGFALSNAIVVSNFLTNALTPSEMRALIAHELAHIVLGHLKKRIAYFGVIGLTIVSVAALANLLFPSIDGLAVIAGSIIVWYLAIRLSLFAFRKQEFAADKYAAELIGDPNQLSAMLKKLHVLALLPKGEVDGIPKTHPTLDERSSALDTDSE